MEYWLTFSIFRYFLKIPEKPSRSPSIRLRVYRSDERRRFERIEKIPFVLRLSKHEGSFSATF